MGRAGCAYLLLLLLLLGLALLQRVLGDLAQPGAVVGRVRAVRLAGCVQVELVVTVVVTVAVVLLVNRARAVQVQVVVGGRSLERVGLLHSQG